MALLALLLSRLDWSRAVSLIRDANPGWLALLLALQSADRVLMALKWEQLLRVLDPRLGKLGAIRVYYESTFVGFAMPLGGLGPDIVRFVRLRMRGVEPPTALVSMVMERVTGLVATLALVTAGLVALAELVPPGTLRDFSLAAAAGAVVAGTLAAASIFHRAPGRAFSWLLTRSRVTSTRAAPYLSAARAYSGRRRVLAVNLVLSAIEQTAPVWAFWIGSRVLDMPLPLIVCLAVAPVTSVIQRLPISYAGLGLREGSAAALLVVLGYNYSDALVLLMMLFMTFFVSLLPGAVIFKRSERLAPAKHVHAHAVSTSAGPDRS